jgi:uncharacterized protein (DUF342 family)
MAYDIVKELDSLSKEIDKAKSNIAQFEGQKIQLMKQLKDLGYSSVEEAGKDLTKMDNQLIALGEEIEKGFKELKENYEW